MNADLAALVDNLATGGPEAIEMGELLHARMTELYPLPRSLTGDGVRASLALLGNVVDIERHEVPTGTEAFDWTVNDEWNLREAWIADASGKRIVDVARHNLHVVGYSVPVRETLSLDELRPHLHSLPDHPDWIPYRTSYYHRDWGFCLEDRVLQSLDDGPYDVVIDADLGPGSMTYGEIVIPGDTDDVVMFTANLCHPAIANETLSSLVLATQLAQTIGSLPSRRFTYRFLFAPATIGPILWASRNREAWASIRHGLVLTGLGGPGSLVYKSTRHGDRGIDRAVGHVVDRRGGEIRGYSPYGYDERQFNALGFDLPFGRLSRIPFNEYPEYHTSADNLEYVQPSELADAYSALLSIVDALENDRTYLNLSPYGEPQLGKRGIYPTTGGHAAGRAVMAMLWTLGYADGSTSLLDIARTAGVDFADLRTAAKVLEGAGLLRET
jgi:aminopeptidase-like protein